MYAVTPVGSFLIDKMNKNLERGLISRKEWSQEIIMIFGDHKAFGKGACSLAGCKYPSMWRAPYLSSDAAMPSWGRLCGGCAEWHGAGIMGLEPIVSDGIYRPEVNDALDISTSTMNGHWSVWLNGNPYDSMNGYGYPWAMAELRSRVRPAWVSNGSVQYTDPDTGYSTVVSQYYAR